MLDWLMNEISSALLSSVHRTDENRSSHNGRKTARMIDVSRMSEAELDAILAELRNEPLSRRL